jgi:heptosyltransferase-2
MMKIGVFLPNWIGDAVMATPTLRALRTHFLTAEIVAVARPYVADVLAGLDSVDRVITCNPRGRGCEQNGWRLARRLFHEQFHTLVLLPNSMRSALTAWFSRAPQRVGFARDGRTLLLTHPVWPKPKSTPHPVLDEYLRLTEPLGCRPRSRQTELCVLPEDEAALAAFWKTQPGGRPQSEIIALNPGGAFGAAKHWPTPHFVELARRLARDGDRTVLVLCGPDERETAREIVAGAADPRVVSLAGVTPSLGLTKAAVRSARLLITTDSGPRHFAQPFGVPVVTLFGPTHIAWSETHYEKARHLQIPIDCGPCQQRTCPKRHHRCMTDLTPETVHRAALDLLARTATPIRRAG